MAYTTRQIAALYSVSIETIRIWTLEFAEYLSPTAQPGRNKNRVYTVSDLEVLALVSELKGQGKIFSDVHLALKAGQRGAAPNLEPQEMQAISYGEREKRLSLEVDHLQHAILRLTEQLKEAQAKAAEAQVAKDENIRLKAQLDYTQRNLDETKERLDRTLEKLTERIEHLSQQIGREYAKGFLEALEQQRNSMKKEE